MRRKEQITNLVRDNTQRLTQLAMMLKEQNAYTDSLDNRQKRVVSIFLLYPLLFYLNLMLVGFINPRQQLGYMTERAPRLMSDNFTCCHTRQSGETMTSVSAGHIILTPTQPGGSRLPQWESNPGPPNQELCALLTDPPRPVLNLC